MGTERAIDHADDSALPPILQIVGDGAAGGGTTVVLQLSQELAAQGAQVTVASQAGSFILKQAKDADLATLPLDFTPRGNTLALSRRLSRYLRMNADTLVHAHGAYAERITRLLGDDLLYAAMRRNAVSRARKLFSFQNQLRSYVSLYARAVLA